MMWRRQAFSLLRRMIFEIVFDCFSFVFCCCLIFLFCVLFFSFLLCFVVIWLFFFCIEMLPAADRTDGRWQTESSDFCNFLRIFASNNQSIANGRIASVFATLKWLNMQAMFTLVSLHWFHHTTPTILYPPTPSGRIPWIGFLKPSLFLGVCQIYFVLPNPNPGVSTLSLMIVIAYFYCLCCYFYCYIHCCYFLLL